MALKLFMQLHKRNKKLAKKKKKQFEIEIYELWIVMERIKSEMTEVLETRKKNHKFEEMIARNAVFFYWHHEKKKTFRKCQ